MAILGYSDFLDGAQLPPQPASQENQAVAFANLTSDITQHHCHKTQLVTRETLSLGPSCWEEYQRQLLKPPDVCFCVFL